MNVALVALGRMGANRARRLSRAAFEVPAFDRGGAAGELLARVRAGLGGHAVERKEGAARA